jgi:superfamily II RNA helicase
VRKERGPELGRRSEGRGAPIQRAEGEQGRGERQRGAGRDDRRDRGQRAADEPEPRSRSRNEGSGEGRGEAASPVEAARGASPSSGGRRWRGYTLNDFQLEAVEAIDSGSDALVSAPTGAGKTLVAEYAIHDAVARGRRAIYTAPIKALSNQKFRDFRAQGLDTGLMTGDVTISPAAQVLVMTTEILRNSILEDPRSLSDVAWVVFDEVHYMDDLERGSVWEESLIFAPAHMRFVCLSATVPNLDDLGAWLSEIRGREMRVVRSTRRPVPLHWNLYTPESGPFDPGELEAVRKRETAHIPRERQRGGGRRLPREAMEAPDPLPLIEELAARGDLPALVFSFSRKDCERLARRMAGLELLSAEEHRRILRLQEELVEAYRLEDAFLDDELMRAAREGIAWHHAGMLPIHKEVVERLFTAGVIRLLFTTETFALGINAPARTVVFAGLRKFDGVSFDYVSTRDFMQMAGRAGRQGHDVEGLVFLMLSKKDLVEAPLRRILSGAPEAVTSRFNLSYGSILHLVERVGRARVHEAWEKSFDRWLHKGEAKKKEDKSRKANKRVVEARLAVLDRLAYLDGDRLTTRGRVAKLINGWELETTELLFSGAIENQAPRALACVFLALVWEERRRFVDARGGGRLLGPLRDDVERAIRRLVHAASEEGLEESIRTPDWGLTEALDDWYRGATLAEIEARVDATPGDIVRAFRMAVQLMRQVRHAIDPDWDLWEQLGAAMEAIDRDEVDARRQLESG